ALPAAGRREEPLREGLELVGVARGQVEDRAELLAVVQGEFGAGDRGLTLAELGGGVGAEGGQDGLNMLAGAQGVGLEVGALAEVVADVKAADADAVLPAAGRVGHPVVTEDAVAP